MAQKVNYTSAEIKKFLVASAGLIGMILTTILALGPDLFSPRVLVWAQVVLAIGTSYGVFKVKNADFTDPIPKPNENITKQTP